MSLPIMDLQKSYSEGVNHGFKMQTPHTFQSNIRFQLANARVEDLFLKWLHNGQSQKLIQGLINDVKSGNRLNLQNQPNPLFVNKMSMSALQQSQIQSSPNAKSAPIRPNYESPSKTDQHVDKKQPQLEESLKQSTKLDKQSYDQIPQFYFPEGKLLDASLVNEQSRLINEIFKTNELQEIDFVQVTSQVCCLPKLLNKILFNRIDTEGKGKITKQQFMNYWHLNLFSKTPQERCFIIVKNPNNNFIEPQDFQPILKVLLDIHPGLEFLQATPEFQERYSETVILRIFYSVNRRDNGRIIWREFKQSNLFQVLELVDREEDINKIRQYFSYEHFYVIYCKFWELDSDHDFFISKDDFSKYSAHGLTKKTVDRIFDQIPRKFKSQQPGKMCFEDFLWFIICEEDKTTIQSIEYWFKVIDLDDNGIISGQEMEYFYEEQNQRLEYLNQEPVYFQDYLCQMVDLLHPDDEIKFTKKHFKDNLQVCGVFFNFLTNLNKLIAFEQKDPFQAKNEQTENPDFTEWDRFAQQEYIRLAMEEENQEEPGMFEEDIANDNETQE